MMHSGSSPIRYCHLKFPIPRRVDRAIALYTGIIEGGRRCYLFEDSWLQIVFLHLHALDFLHTRGIESDLLINWEKILIKKREVQHDDS